VQAGVNLEKRIETSKAEQIAHEWAGAGTSQIRVFRLSPSVQEHEFADARAVDGAHATEIEDDFTAVFQNVPDQARKRGGLVTVDDAALAVNDDHIAAISSFQTEFNVDSLS